MAATPLYCAICGTKTTAVIADLQAYDEHEVPVWHCPTCNLSVPVLTIDRQLWVDEYRWEPPSFAYGGVSPDPMVCLGCGTKTMLASLNFLMIEAFPFWESRQPAWVCHRCGFADRAVYANRYLWADSYNDWK